MSFILEIPPVTDSSETIGEITNKIYIRSWQAVSLILTQYRIMSADIVRFCGNGMSAMIRTHPSSQRCLDFGMKTYLMILYVWFVN